MTNGLVVVGMFIMGFGAGMTFATKPDYEVLQIKAHTHDRLVDMAEKLKLHGGGLHEEYFGKVRGIDTWIKMDTETKVDL